MKKYFLIVIIAAIFIIGAYYISQKLPAEDSSLSNLNAPTMQITSPAFKNNGKIPAKYTCDGENVNPPLEISGTPENAKSLVLIIDDPDAPMGTWTHWLVWNIDPLTKEVAENSVPAGSVEGKTSFGKPGYGGPCPPSGTHRYFFKIYALDMKLDLSANTDRAGLEKAMPGHILAAGELVGLYGRK